MASARKTLDVNYMTLRKVRPLDDRNARYPSNYIYAVADDGNAVFVNTLDNLETYGIDISELYYDAVRNPMTSDLDASGFQIYDLKNITLTPQASNPVSGPDASSTVWYNSSNNHLYVGGADLQSGSGGSLPTATIFGQSIYWNGSAYVVTDTSVFLGQYAGSSSGPGSFKVAIGQEAGESNQGGNAIGIGNTAGGENQGTFSVAIGSQSGACDQNSYAVAIGANAANDTQGSCSVAIGAFAGYCNQDVSSVAIGFNAGYTSQGPNSVAIGASAGSNLQSSNAVAIGCGAGQINQQSYSVAIGDTAGQSNQKSNAVAIGNSAGIYDQSSNAIAIGNYAGVSNQSQYSVAIGSDAGNYIQGAYSVAIGFSAASGAQSNGSVAVGASAGRENQDSSAVSIGFNAGYTSQGPNSVAIGASAGSNLQSSNAVAIGNSAGASNQQPNAVAIGFNSGQNSQGSNAIAIGTNAGLNNQPNNSIVLNATGSIFNGDLSNATYITPVRTNDTTVKSVMGYDLTRKEVVTTSALYSLNGNVGIGTNAPSVPLDVSGTVQVTQFSTSTATTASVLSLRNANAGGRQLMFYTFLSENDYNDIVQTGDKGILYDGSGLVIAPEISGVGGIRMDNSGIFTAYDASDIGIIALKPNGNTGHVIRFGGPGSNANKLAFVGPGDTEYMQLDNGNVGIGTNTPAYTLDVSGDTKLGEVGQVRPLLIQGGTSGTSGVQIQGTDTTNATWRIGTPSTDVIGIGGNRGHNVTFGNYGSGNTSYTEFMRIDSSEQHVGIGTSTPSVALEVSGNVIVNGTLTSRLKFIDHSGITLAIDSTYFGAYTYVTGPVPTITLPVSSIPDGSIVIIINNTTGSGTITCPTQVTIGNTSAILSGRTQAYAYHTTAGTWIGL